jgi:hypothetical protein
MPDARLEENPGTLLDVPHLGVSDLCQIRLITVDHSRTPAEPQTAQRSRPDMR